MKKKKRKWSCSVLSDSVRTHGLQPTRLLHSWDFPGKSTGMPSPSPHPSLGFPMAQMVKNLPAMQETWIWSLQKGMATHSSIPAWRIAWTEKPGGLRSMGLKSQTLPLSPQSGLFLRLSLSFLMALVCPLQSKHIIAVLFPLLLLPGVSPLQTYRWPTGTCKDAQPH